jgi:hypothetical protein
MMIQRLLLWLTWANLVVLLLTLAYTIVGGWLPGH